MGFMIETGVLEVSLVFFIEGLVSFMFRVSFSLPFIPTLLPVLPLVIVVMDLKPL